MEQEEKLLLLGPGGAGKTCMRSIIFENYFPRDALRLGITISLDQNRVHILRNLFLNLLDGGGQHQYVLEYLNKQREYIFRKVAVMLFVFDICSLASPDSSKPVASSNHWTKQDMLSYFRETIYNIQLYSPQAKVFVLLHKIDLIHETLREKIFSDKKIEILNVLEEMRVDQAGGHAIEFPEIQFFGTSIWNDSLYCAYSSVVRSLIPNREKLVDVIRSLAFACKAVEVALYERSTFLCLAHVTRRVMVDGQPGNEGAAAGEGAPPSYRISDGELRTSQVSEIVKHFKLSCMNNTTSLDGFTMETPAFTAILTPFTEFVHVLVVCDAGLGAELHRLNINAARTQFQNFLNSDEPGAAAMRNVL